MNDFADKAADAVNEGKEKFAADDSNSAEQTLNEKLGRAHLDHNDNDDKFGGND